MKRVIKSFDNSNIFYWKYKNNKSNEYIILLHSLGSNHTLFNKIIKFLIKKRYNIINVDLRGHGYSENLKTDLKLVYFTKDIYYIIQKEKIKKIFLIGNCLGGTIALKFYLLYPNFIKKLILINTSYTLNVKTLRPFLIIPEFFSFEIMNLFYILINKKKKKNIDFSKNINSLFLPILASKATSLRTIHNSIKAMYKENFYNILKKIKIPTLLIKDKNDYIFSKLSYNLMSKKIKKNNLITIEGSHYFLSVSENPKSLEESIINFINNTKDINNNK